MEGGGVGREMEREQVRRGIMGWGGVRLGSEMDMGQGTGLLILEMRVRPRLILCCDHDAILTRTEAMPQPLS